MNFCTADDCQEGRRRLDAACEAAGRDPSTLPLSVMTNALVGADERELERRAARQMARRGQTGDPREFLESLGPERIAGTPARVLERLAEDATAGVRRVMLQHLLHDDLEAVALIGSEIIPEAASL